MEINFFQKKSRWLQHSHLTIDFYIIQFGKCWRVLLKYIGSQADYFTVDFLIKQVVFISKYRNVYEGYGALNIQ